jgi:hypothetical protein
MSTMVKVRPDYGPVREMDIEALDALYLKPIDDRVIQAIKVLRQSIKSTVKTGIEWHKVWMEVHRGLCWNDEDEDDDHPTSDGTWKAWSRNHHKAMRVKAERAEWRAERAAKAESATAA